ncbi:MAG: hypothetical protein WBC44_19480 [Planctomycetaceae bacterium]
MASLKKGIAQSPNTGAAVLGAMALVKADQPVDLPEIQAVVEAVQKRCEGEKYKPETNHYYTAGLEMMLLESVDPEQYRAEMEKILAYILAGQRSSGAWYYPDMPQGTGDTSITQYAALGMWAADRAGLPVPKEAWDRMAVWHLKTQNKDGGFSYHPDERDWMNRSLPALTLGGAANLLLARLHLFPDAERRAAEREEAAQAAAREETTGKRYGVLEAVDIDAGPDKKTTAGNTRYSPASTDGAIEQSVGRAAGHAATRFVLPPNTVWKLYYLYGLERMAALGNMESLGEHDWYAEGTKWLIENQTKDGAWVSNGGPVADTAFGILFLTRSTSKMLGRTYDVPELGGGLLAGGRGLPSDLNQAKPSNAKKGETSPLDELLARLEDAKATDVPGVQQAVLEAVRFGDREALIGQRDRLRLLADDPRAEVRRTAYWALGRGGDLSDVPRLIKGLSDADVAVAVEAQNALCVLARRPTAFGVAGDPFGAIPESATDAVRDQALAAWRKKAIEAWTAWYERVAPYEERDGLGLFRE